MNSIAVINGSYDYRLVGVSALLAMCMSYTGFEMAERTMAARGSARRSWLAFGGTAMGIGLWAALYLGTLAFSLPVPIFYHYPTLALGMLMATISSALGLFVATRERKGMAQAIAASIAVGGGLAAIPFIDVAAIRVPARLEYRWGLGVVSASLAVIIFLLILLFVLRFLQVRQPTVSGKVISAISVGSAIALLPSLTLWVVRFHPSAQPVALEHTLVRSSLGVAAIAGTAFLVLAGAVITSVLDGLLQSQQKAVEKTRESEIFFRSLSEAVPEIIWTATPDGMDDYFNQRLFDYTGMTFDQLAGSAWKQIVHADDVDDCFLKWGNALRIGEPYEVQYRLRGKDGAYRWFLGRASPIRDGEGQIVKWFGTCTDIENQKANEQVLEEQILERTKQLADANVRLQEEMAEKDHARRQLDEEHEGMMKDLQQRSERAAMLAKMGELLQSCISRDEVITVALSFAPKIFPNTRGAVFWMNSCRSSVEVIGSWSDCELAATDFEVGDCWALRTGHPHLVYADESTARCKHAAELSCSHLCIPILAQGETLGILHLQKKQNAARLDPAELSFRMTFAGQIGLSIANIKLRDALRTQSIRDALTGLYNRRYLEEILEREIRRSARAQQHLGIIVIDLDHFKNFNDAYGHDAGDAVLRETGLLLTKCIRAEDFVCRYGGEEFVVILPTANLEAAQARAENLRVKMRKMTILYQGNSMGMVTISAGVAAFPDHGATPKELMASGDAALYRAKRNGRDQVEVASSTTARDEIETSPSAKPASAANS